MLSGKLGKNNRKTSKEEVKKMTNIINLTPHKINIVDEEGNVVKIFESSGEARAAQKDVEIGTLEGIPIIETEFGKPVNLPEYNQGTYYIVSAITAKAAYLSGRNTQDLLLTAKTVRNDDGQIIGCQALARYR